MSMLENMFGLGESTSFDEDEVLSSAQMSFETGHHLDRDDFASDEEYNKYREYMDMGPSGFYSEHPDLDWDPDFVSEYGAYDLLDESNKPEFKVGDIVTHIDYNPPTKGTILDIQDDVAYITITGDTDSVVEVPLDKLQFAEEIDESKSIKEDTVTIPNYDTEIADLLLTAYKAAKEAVTTYTKTGIISDVKSFISIVLSNTERANELLGQKAELTEDVDTILDAPKDPESLEMSDLLNKAIKDEYDTISLYNQISLLAKDRSYNDLVELIDHINTEENNHVGLLQEALKTVSENAEAITDGQSEALEFLELKESSDEYETRKKNYLKAKEDFETLGEEDNNDVLSREDKMRIAKAELDKLELKEGNPISNQLPPSIDQFLQDLAQEFGYFTYNDIINHKFTEQEIKKLRYLRTKINQLMEEIPDPDDDTDYIIDKYVEKVADIISKKNESVLTEDYISSKQYWVDTAKGILSDASVEYDGPFIEYGTGHLGFNIEPNDEVINRIIDTATAKGFKEVERHIVDNGRDDSYVVFTKEDPEEGRLVLGIVMNAEADYASLDIGYSRDDDDDEWFEESAKLELK